MDFEVFRKRGKHWQYLGTYWGKDSSEAARKAGYVHNCKVLGVRPAGTPCKLFVHRFQYTPTLTG